MTEARTGPALASRPVLHRAIRVVTTIEMALAGAALLLVFGLVLIQAAQRYLPIDGWSWTGELARYGLVWLTFVAAGVLVTRDGHIALQIVDSIRSEIVVRVVRVFALLVVAATGLALAWECWTLIQDSHNLTTPSLGMSMSMVYALPLLGFVSTSIRGLVAAVLMARYGAPAAQRPDELAIGVNGQERS